MPPARLPPDWPDKLKGNRTWRLGERHEFSWNRRAEDLGLVAGVDIAMLPPIEAVRHLLEQSRPVLEEIETAELSVRSGACRGQASTMIR
jgi:hypothetical protein